MLTLQPTFQRTFSFSLHTWTGPDFFLPLPLRHPAECITYTWHFNSFQCFTLIFNFFWHLIKLPFHFLSDLYFNCHFSFFQYFNLNVLTAHFQQQKMYLFLFFYPNLMTGFFFLLIDCLFCLYNSENCQSKVPRAPCPVLWVLVLFN